MPVLFGRRFANRVRRSTRDVERALRNGPTGPTPAPILQAPLLHPVRVTSTTKSNNLYPAQVLSHDPAETDPDAAYEDQGEIWLQGANDEELSERRYIARFSGEYTDGVPVFVTYCCDDHDTGVVSGTYGSADEVGAFTVADDGRLTHAENVSIAIDASQVISGTLVHERGGLEANVSAGDGFVEVKSGTTTVIKTKHNATAAPTKSDDAAAGYVVGSRWIDTTGDDEYVCVDSTNGAAVWLQTNCSMITVRWATTQSLPAYTRVGDTITANADGALSTTYTDGVTIAVGDLFLLQHGAAAADNGVHRLVSAGSGGTPWSAVRTSHTLTSGMLHPVSEGNLNGCTLYKLSPADPITPNTTAVYYKRMDTPDYDAHAATTAALPSYTPSSDGYTLTGSGTLASTYTDGYPITAGALVLVQNEASSNGRYNGLYRVTATSPWTLQRYAAPAPGMRIYPRYGLIYGGRPIVILNQTPTGGAVGNQFGPLFELPPSTSPGPIFSGIEFPGGLSGTVGYDFGTGASVTMGSGQTLVAGGPTGTVQYFDGTSDVNGTVGAAGSICKLTNATTLVWFYVEDFDAGALPNGNRHMWTENTSTTVVWTIGIGEDGVVGWAIVNGSGLNDMYAEDDPINVKQWYCAAFRLSSTDGMDIFLNGKKVAHHANTSPSTGTITEVRMGRNGSQAAPDLRVMKGAIGKIVTYPSALTDKLIEILSRLQPDAVRFDGGAQDGAIRGRFWGGNGGV